MIRTRSGHLAFVAVLSLLVGLWPATFVSPTLAAAVAWPTSTLVISEFQTGGASASDEFVELANQGSGPADLMGLEVAYATSSGSTVTRKATWTVPTILEAGRRILIANGSGSFLSMADVAYSGGFAAAGGALVLRVVGGSPLDAVGWGDASSGFVEGVAGAPPPAGSSLERAPGGASGNGRDTNDNATDWFVQAAPTPQGLAAPPVPVPVATPMPTATPTPTPVPTPDLTPTPAPTPEPTPEATPTPAPTPEPTPEATPTPTPVPTPITVPINVARGFPDDTPATIDGVLTVALGSIESGRTGFVEDVSGGIGIYLDAAVVGSFPAGTTVRIIGTLGSRYGQRVLRVAETDIVPGDVITLLAPFTTTTGAASEVVEGTRIVIGGAIATAPSDLADGLAFDVDDGTGPVRVIVGPAALGVLEPARGQTVTVRGPLGQRDSTGTGLDGYRVYAMEPGDLAILEPDPTPTPVPTPEPTPTPTPTPAPTPTPTAAPTPTPSAATIASIRDLPVGSTVHVRAVVVAEAGRIGTPRLVAVADGTAGIAVRLPIGFDAPARNTVVTVRGKLAAPYGQLEIRPTRDGLISGGAEPPPAAVDLGMTRLGEDNEGRLVSLTGRLTKRAAKASGGDLILVIERSDGSLVKVMTDASSGLGQGSFQTGATYRLTGVVGQRATRSGATDGYRVWLRGLPDVVKTAGPSPSPSPTASGSASSTSAPGTLTPVSIARARGMLDRLVAIVGVVTAPATLLDRSGRLIVIQDATGAIEVRLPADADAPPLGARIRAEGTIGTAYDAPRLKADRIERLGTVAVPSALTLHAGPTVSHEWRLVTVRGRLDSIRKLGDRWRAELIVGNARVVIVGQSGAGIPVTVLFDGRTATVTGIVRRPYPTATDRRFTILPRRRSDLKVDAARTTPTPTAASGGTVADPTGLGGGNAPGAQISGGNAIADADIRDLSAHLGETVRIGGLVVDPFTGGFELDDGTAVGPVVLRGDAAELLVLVGPGDAINVTGRVESTDRGPTLVADDPAGIILAAMDKELANPSDEPDASTEVPATAGVSDGGPRTAGLWMLPGTDIAGAAGLLTLAIVTAISLAVTVIRRRHLQGLLAARVAVRLAAFAGPAGDPRVRPADAQDPPGTVVRGARTAEHDPRTPDPA